MTRRKTESAKEPFYLPNLHKSHETLDCHWKTFPGNSKNFILDTLDKLSLQKLLSFWSSSQYIEYTRGKMAGSLCVTSWYLALVYLNTNRFREARALVLNGAFLQQCYSTTIEGMLDICGRDFSKQFSEDEMPYYTNGFFSVTSVRSMQSYLREKLPLEYQRMMAAMVNKSSTATAYVDQVSADWNSSSSKHGKRTSQENEDEGQIRLILVDELSGDRCSFHIGVSRTLKCVFNEYADKRGVSLRTLRFSYSGKTLFLSSVGHKTPKDLGMVNEDVINVGSISVVQACGGSTSTDLSSAKSSSKSKAKSRTCGSKKSKNKGRKKGSNNKCSFESRGDYKEQHSSLLTQIFEEAEPKFREIRQSLNALSIKNCSPKEKTRKSKPKSETQLVFNPPTDGLGGKAGKSHFVINVGQIENLYRTTKPSAARQTSYSSPITLDLHGCTKQEALKKLDQGVGEWHDEAMRGSYPWIKPVVIVCGCGNQILSETVEQWIKDSDRVSNVPKSMLPRRYAGRAA